MKKILFAACVLVFSFNTSSSYSQSLKQKIKQQQSSASSADQRCDELKAKVQYGRFHKHGGLAFFVDSKGSISRYRNGFCSYGIYRLGQTTVQYLEGIGPTTIPAAKCYRGANGNFYSNKKFYEPEVAGNELVIYEQFIQRNCTTGSLNEGPVNTNRFSRMPGR